MKECFVLMEKVDLGGHPVEVFLMHSVAKMVLASKCQEAYVLKKQRMAGHYTEKEIEKVALYEKDNAFYLEIIELID